MSEKVLAVLFRLYPAAFRERYLHEALLLCRDRRRDETGIDRRLRLICDLLVDFFAGFPIAWRASYSIAAARPRTPNGNPVPSFRMLDATPLRPTSILLGGIFSMAAFSFFVLVLRTTALYPTERHALSPIESVLQRLNEPALHPPKGTASIRSHMRAAPPQILPAHDNAPERQPASASPIDGHASLTPAGHQPASTQTGAVATSVPAISEAQGQRKAAASQYQLEPQDATQAIIKAISAHQIVMFGETHGNKQEYEWLCRLVKTPAFADSVDDIVVEFGNSLYQKTVDHYIAGEDVPQEEVEKAWRNMVGAVGPVSPVYGWFYQAVRQANFQLRGRHKIRLLLGDPYGDWNKINNAEGLGPYLAHRDEWYAEVVKEEVLAHHHRALLIMGAGHFVRRNGPGLVEQAVRAAGVQPYLVAFGTNAVGGYDDLDHRFDRWSLPAIVALSDSWVGELPANPVLTGGEVAPNSQKMKEVADAMLYAGSRDTLIQVFVPRSELVNTAYGKEVERRLQIQTGRTMDFTQASEGPQYQKPPQQTVSSGIHRLPPNPPKSITEPLPPRPLSQ